MFPVGLRLAHPWVLTRLPVQALTVGLVPTFGPLSSTDSWMASQGNSERARGSGPAE